MGEVTIIGVDLAKNVFQVHGAAADGSVLFRKKLSRPQFARFMAEQRPCRVAMEACASAHHWARQMTRHGHEVRFVWSIVWAYQASSVMTTDRLRR
jgi:transposase